MVGRQITLGLGLGLPVLCTMAALGHSFHEPLPEIEQEKTT